MRIGVTERGDGGISLDIVLYELKFKSLDFAIIMTKNPTLLIERNLPENTIIHCTITGHGGTKIEPNVISSEKAIAAYNVLIDKYGGERVVLRIDPVFPFNEYVNIAKNILKFRRGRVRISFLDAYEHSKRRLKEIGITIPYNFHARIELRKRILDEFKTSGEIEVCGEPGLECAGCVSIRDIRAVKLEEKVLDNSNRQRLPCKCLSEKFELLQNKCRCYHKCAYCYWKDEEIPQKTLDNIN